MSERMQFTIEDARLIWRNFSGSATMFKPAGERTFNIVLPEDIAVQMTEDGWNVRLKEPKEEGDEPFYFIEVKVGFDKYPPRVVMITDNARTQLDEGTIGVLDYADIVSVDLICNSYNWSYAGKTGIKAYLKTMFVTVREDFLERKYDYYGSQARELAAEE